MPLSVGPEDDNLYTPPPGKPFLSPLPLTKAQPIPSFLTSPITPHNAPIPPLSLSPSPSPSEPPPFTSTQHEHELLQNLRRLSDRHRNVDLTLRARIVANQNAHYLDKRPIIVGWLIDVCQSYSLSANTLHLAIRYLDWLLALTVLHQNSWQCAAVAAVYIAAKAEELPQNVPNLTDLYLLCERQYNLDSIREMETCIISQLKWDLVVKTPIHFLSHYLVVIGRNISENRKNRKNHTNVNNFPSTTTSLNACVFDDDEDDEDYDTDNYSCDFSMQECVCMEDVCICDEDDLDIDLSDEPAHRVSEQTALQCDEEMLEQTPRLANRDVAFNHTPLDPVEELRRIATCVLDLSLYAPMVRERFAPRIIAAAALSISTEVAVERAVRQVDVCAVSDLWETQIAECRTILWKLFEEAQA